MSYRCLTCVWSRNSGDRVSARVTCTTNTVEQELEYIAKYVADVLQWMQYDDEKYGRRSLAGSFADHKNS